LSLLYTFTPDELRLILVDPKQVEMQIYNTIPHLVTPVVTEAKKAQAALGLVIREMEKRYQILAKVGVRNITAFNARTKIVPKAPETKSTPPEGENDNPPPEATEQLSLLGVARDTDLVIPDKLPYWVVIVDELADLMQSEASTTVESHIARITAKARAAGIHLIVATQTPRREVVTGIIKTNIPSRISFQVPSALDSRVILDEMGAENLLGKGDLLYLPPGSAKLVRGQGAFVSDDEVKAVVDFCAEQAPVQFDTEFHSKLARQDSDEELSEDTLELLVKGWEVVQQEGRATTSVIQRRLKIGYNRAADLMSFYEKNGLISEADPASKSKPREIEVDLDTFDIRKFLGIE
jgi:S-DNA-T family DNA segregation ATPase FtsK/SpoIIIE